MMYWNDLDVWLKSAANRMKKKPIAGAGSPEVPDEPVLIRADQSTPFKYVQYIMERCGQEGTQIWKLQLAVSTPDTNQGGE
ncbi:MAG: hypothetical protein P8M11_14420, partial [Planctomycetota bacterium]|nr:hypothetical protein [Planctomycetota bacterium]